MELDLVVIVTLTVLTDELASVILSSFFYQNTLESS